MQNISRRRWLALTMLVAVCTCTHAQPNVLKMVVPFPAGGITDQAARIVAEGMGRQLGQTVIVENRPGAGGRIGIDTVARAAPDGNTVLFTNASYGILPIIEPKIAFDPLKSLAPVGTSATYSMQIVVRKDMPANSLSEFVAYAQKNPGKLSYGSAGVGSGANFAGEYFKALTGTSLVHVPYKSTSAALADVAGGQLDLVFDASSRPLVEAGRVKLLAVTDDKRDPRFPSTPTVVEAGLKDLVMKTWVGLLAPVGTPQAVVERLGKAAAEAVAAPAAQKRLAELGMLPQGGTPAQMAENIRNELALYRGIAQRAKLQFD